MPISPKFYNEPETSWNSLTAWMDTWYESPDMDGLKICLCAIASHYYAQERPLWVLAIGEPGSGKTEIIIQTLRTVPQARIVGALTPKCFLSSFKRGKNDTTDYSMLTAGGNSHIWLAKDFTTFAAMRFEDRNVVASRLREIWDGELVSDTGGGGMQSWQGKVTMLAVATPGFERHWAALSDLGERFMTLRWCRGDRQGAMQKARRQAGCEDTIREVAQGHIMDILAKRRTTAEMPRDVVMHKRDCMAEVICLLRCHVEREAYGKREVIDVAPPEFPTRVSFALSQLVRTHMDLFHHDTPSAPDFNLAERLALDTIPQANRKILECIPSMSTEGVKYGTLLRKNILPENTLRRRLEDLTLTNIIKPYSGADWGERVATLTDDFREILNTSGMSFKTRAPLIEMPKLVKRVGHKASFLPEDND